MKKIFILLAWWFLWYPWGYTSFSKRIGPFSEKNLCEAKLSQTKEDLLSGKLYGFTPSTCFQPFEELDPSVYKEVEKDKVDH